MRARIRTLKPEMWADERIGALSRDARLLLLGMITMADDEGRFRARRSAILGHVFPADDDALELVDTWIGEISDQGIVVFYVVDDTPYGAFRHWRRHQRINRPNASDLPPPSDPKVVRDNRVKRHGAFSERSVKAHGVLSESSVINHGVLSVSCAGARSDPILSSEVDVEKTKRLCERLAARIRENDPKAEPQPESERWRTDMRRLVADRKGDVAEVERIIDWCQQDSFWRSNVLSPAKLRKQFTQLVLRQGSGNGGSHLPPGQRPGSEWLAQVEEHLAAQETAR